MKNICNIESKTKVWIQKHLTSLITHFYFARQTGHNLKWLNEL